MATAGHVLRQGDTDTLRFVRTSADTDGEHLDVDVSYAPMTDLRPPLHYHPYQDEHFRVLDGELSVVVGDRHHTLTAGDELTVARGQRHSMWNSGPSRVRFRWQTTPALRTEAMFETFWGLVEAGRAGRHGQPRPPLLQSLLLIWTYRNEWRPCAPPPAVSLPLSAVLALPARLLGHRTHYPLNSGGTP